MSKINIFIYVFLGLLFYVVNPEYVDWVLCVSVLILGPILRNFYPVLFAINIQF